MTAASDKGRHCSYHSCGFNPELNTTCARVRQAYGVCDGPCDGPCYVATLLKRCNGFDPDRNIQG